MKQNGNALFLILIAVALFAALSYAVTQSGRGGGNIDRETQSLQTANLVQYFSNMSFAVQKMILGGCNEIEIDFVNTVSSFHTTFSNPNSGGAACQVFNSAGGGLAYQRPDSAILDASRSSERMYGEIFFNGDAEIVDVGQNGQSELLMIIPWVKEEVCIEINTQFNLPRTNITEAGAAFTLAEEPATSGNIFQGAYANFDVINAFDSALDGAQTACFEGAAASPSGGFHIYHVLHAR